MTPRAAPAVLHSGEYFLFESDSEEEEEAAVPEEPQPGRQSAFQVSMAGGTGSGGLVVPTGHSRLLSPCQLAYQAWVTNTRTALRQQEQPEAAGAEVAAGGSGLPQNGGGGGGWGAGGDAALRCSPLFALGVVGIPYCGIASGWFPVCVDSPVSTVGWV